MTPSSLPLSLHWCRTEAERAEAMHIRLAVFVDEQCVPVEREADEYDQNALHLLAHDEQGHAVGTLRIVDKGNGTAKIGRVAVMRSQRGQGIGAVLIRSAIDKLREDGFAVVILDAQLTVIGFYERLGFQAEGPVFDDAGIAHRRMRLPLTSA